jgi:fumarylpyruvate hydrolase
MEFVFPAMAMPSVPVAGTGKRFPVRRIFCIGRNYEDHAKEMGFNADREAPFFFLKPADAIVMDGTSIPYAKGTKNLHHEIELVVAIGRAGSDIPKEAALDHVYGYAVGNDLTRRDLQIASRDKGRPWDIGKAFDQSAPIGSIRRAEEIGHPGKARIWLSVNGEKRQNSDIDQLIWSVPELIAFMSTLYILQPGDLIYTGTPAGVGPVVPNDVMHGGIDGIGELTTTIR